MAKTAQELFELLEKAKKARKTKVRAPLVHKLIEELGLDPKDFDRPYHVITTATTLVRIRLCKEKGLEAGVLVQTMDPSAPPLRVASIYKNGVVRLVNGAVREPQHLTFVSK